jgi:hypothetical protein
VARSNRTEAKQASKQPATGTLIVRAVTVGGDPVDPADLPAQPALPAGRAVVGDRTEELQDGTARFEGVTAGEQAVELRPGQGFAAPDRLFVLDEQGRPVPADGPIVVRPGEERTVIAACPLVQVHLTGRVELPTVGKARSRPRPDFPITLEVSRAGERLATVTCEQGSLDAWVEASGPVELTAPPLVDKGGRRLVPEQRQVTAEPDGGPVTVRYCHAGAIRVSAILEEDTDIRRAAGVHFTLRDAAYPDEFLEDRTTSSRHPVVVFGDLPPGSYLVAADRETVAGHPPLQLVRPPEGMLLVLVMAGETADLTGDFAFERDPAVVTGDVRDA